MWKLRSRFIVTWTINFVLLFSLLAGCGRGRGTEKTAGQEAVTPTPVIEPYTGPCPSGQSSWDCMAWDKDKWE